MRLPVRVSAVVLGAMLGLVAMGWWLSRPTAEPAVSPADLAALPHRLVVPADGLSGCPGYEAQLPAAPMSAPAVAADTRSDATVLLADGAAILVVCLGTEDEPERIVAEHVSGDSEGFEAVSGPATSSTAFGEAVSWTARVGGDSLLTEWYVEHDGVVMVVGALRPETDATTRGLAEAMLTTWVWD